MADATDDPVWDRWDRLWHGVFYVALLVPTVITTVDPAQPVRTRGTVLAVAAVFAAWHWFWQLRRPDLAARPWPSITFVVGTGMFTWVLLGFSPVFTFLIYGLFPQMFVSLERWGAVPAAALMVLVFVRTGALESGNLGADALAMVGSVALAVVIGLFILAIGNQSEQRRHALAELQAARDDLAAASRRAGMLQERQRLAREMHDTVAQGLTSVVMLLEAADQALPRGASKALGHLDQARAMARESLLEVRMAVLALRPEALRDAPLPEALAETVRRWSEQHSIAAHTRVTGTAQPLAPDVEVSLLRAGQEAMANIAKHARASTVTVTLSFMDATVVLDVHDDGVGFDTEAVHPADARGGFGLTGLRERLQEIGGDLVVESTSESGTTVVATVPTTAVVPS